MRVGVLSSLTRPMVRLLGRDERGAVGVIVAILIGGGVLLGLGAMVLDVGQLYQVRAQLQNGADAGALAVANSCALGTCSPSVAASYATSNAKSGLAQLNPSDPVCGTASGLTPCPASTGAMTDCPTGATGTNYVDVRTESLNANGTSLVPPILARAMLGNSNYQGSTVLACAQASWGPPSLATGLAVTISQCEWDADTTEGTSFAPPPPAVPAQSYDQILQFHGKTHNGCPQDNSSGADGPGIFGWTQDSTGNCQISVTGPTYPDSTGTTISNACKAALNADAVKGAQPVLIPVYTKETNPGANGVYTLYGFAAFVVTGYYFSGGIQVADWLNPANTCKGSQKCIFGYFTHALVPTQGSIGGTNLGADIVELTG